MRSDTHTHKHSDTHTHTHTHTDSHALRHIHTHVLRHTCSHSHRLTHTDTLTHAHTTGKLEEPCGGRTLTRDDHPSAGGIGPLLPSLQEGRTWDGLQALKCPWLLGS